MDEINQFVHWDWVLITGSLITLPPTVLHYLREHNTIIGSNTHRMHRGSCKHNQFIKIKTSKHYIQTTMGYLWALNVIILPVFRIRYSPQAWCISENLELSSVPSIAEMAVGNDAGEIHLLERHNNVID